MVKSISIANSTPKTTSKTEVNKYYDIDRLNAKEKDKITIDKKKNWSSSNQNLNRNTYP
jgi:hypothetical protein